MPCRHRRTTFVVTLTMLTMTLAKVQDYVDGRRGLAQPRRPVVAMLEGVDGRRGPVGHQGCGIYAGREAVVRRLKNGTKDSLTKSPKMTEMCWSAF